VLLRALIVSLLAAASGGAAGPAPPPILFAADNEPALSGDIFRLDANGHLVNLSKSPFADEYPLVSPDGRRVAFVSERGGGPGILRSRNRRRRPAAPRPAAAPDRQEPAHAPARVLELVPARSGVDGSARQHRQATRRAGLGRRCPRIPACAPTAPTCSA
jgi:hypothetical protein